GSGSMAAPVRIHSGRACRRLAWFAVSTAAKQHGARRWLEGWVIAGDAVVVVEDVITSGSALVDAVRKCGEEGLRVLGAVVLVDREEDEGRARVEAALAPLGAAFHALFTRTELESAWRTGRQ